MKVEATTWTFTIPDWTPTPLNKLMFSKVKDRIRLKKADRELVAIYFWESGIPKAAGRRRVSVTIIMPGNLLDPDSPLKSLLDSLKACGALVDDSARWLILGGVEIHHGRQRQTTITLEDMEVTP